jgi:hypothetical protein
VKRPHSSPAEQASDDQAPTGGPLRAWTRFWFTPSDPAGLHVIRLLTGLLLLAWLLPLAGDVPGFFGLNGWFDRQAYAEAARVPGGAPKSITWSLLFLCGGDAGLLRAAYWGSIVVLVLFTLGLGTRLTGLLTWLVVASFTANPAFDDELDPFLLLLTMYLAVGYLLLGLLNRNLSWTERLLGRWDAFLLGGILRTSKEPGEPSVAANVAVRLIQVHLAILLVTTGLHKLQFSDWWSGTAFWFPLHPPLETSVEKLRRLGPEAGSYLGWLSLAAYATLAWQLLFPFFAWRRGFGRVILLGGALAGAVGAASVYGIPLLGLALAVGCLAFLGAEEWRAVRRAWGRLFGLAFQQGQGKRPGELAATPLLNARER